MFLDFAAANASESGINLDALARLSRTGLFQS